MTYRARAQKIWEESGMPDRRQEAWRYTPLAKVVKSLDLPEDANLVSHPPVLAALDPQEVYTVAYWMDHMEPIQDIPGVTCRCEESVEQLGTVVQEEDPITALNGAKVGKGAVLEIAAGTVLDKPIYIGLHGYNAEPAMHATRLYINVGAGAQVTIVEEALGQDADQFQNHVVEINVEEDASVEYFAIQSERRTESVFVGNRYLRLAARARGFLYTFNTATHVARNHTGVEIMGEGAHMDIGGLMYGQERALVDTQVRVAHMVPNATSNQLIRGAYHDQSRGVFQGRIYVAAGAHGTNADQQSKNLLLSRDAMANVQPLLEIYNNDVKCTHGTSTGLMNSDALFYLRSRGVPEEAARKMLLESFFADSLEQITHEKLRSILTDHLHGCL